MVLANAQALGVFIPMQNLLSPLQEFGFYELACLDILAISKGNTCILSFVSRNCQD
jgi:hypothetical protein